MKELHTLLLALEKEDVKLQETRKHLKDKIKSVERTGQDTEKQETTLKRSIEDILANTQRIEGELGSRRVELATASTELDKLTASLQGVAAQFQESLAKKQAELTPLQDQLRDIIQEGDMARSELRLLQDKLDVGQQERRRLEERFAKAKQDLQSATEQQRRLKEEHQRVLTESNRIKSSLETHKQERMAKTKEMQLLQSTLSEALASLSDESSSSTGNTTLKALMKESKAARLSGVHGRLGDLGAIDRHYDTAIATACSYLDHIVVETTEAGQACIDFLRRTNSGRANFIVLEKMRPAVRTPSTDLPEGAQRLFDLVRVKDDRFINAMYFALTETLVAPDMGAAQKWAYAAGGTKRWRVVTLDGKLFETSGTISGGGALRRGGMRAQLSSAVEGSVSEEQVRKLRERITSLQEELRQLEILIGRTEGALMQNQGQLNGLEDEIALQEHSCQALNMEIDLIGATLPKTLTKGQGAAPLSKEEEARRQRLEREIPVLDARADEQRTLMRPAEEAVAAIQRQILDAGGVKYKVQKSRVDGLAEQIEEHERRLTELAKERTSLERRLASLRGGAAKGAGLEQLTIDLSRIDAQINEATLRAVTLQKEINAHQSSLEMRTGEIVSLRERLDELNKSVSRFRKIEYELRMAIEDDEDRIKAHSRTIEEGTRELATLKLNQLDDHTSQPVLAIYEDERDLAEMHKTLPALQQSITSLRNRLAQETPNLKVLEEYRQKWAALQEQQIEFARVEILRASARETYESLCSRRLDEFMLGFRTISGHLKTMYELITMGGMAELELVDSLNPFTEGILFSVMPPNKSWKPISNLSGGEKTLSSLALVFALHLYRPTPIYVMDEIDAALDFKNVSIIAHYIKERTRGAQFIVVSLRNNMFELADRLVGIYKTHQRTKSIAIDPQRFAQCLTAKE